MDDEEPECKPQATNFQKLLLVWPSTEECPFIFTWSPQGVYVFDPKRAEIVLWSDELKGIKDARCQRGEIYIHFMDGSFNKYTLLTVEQGVCKLYQQGLAIHGAQLLLLKKTSLCSSRLNIYVPASFIIDMLQKASEMGKSYLFTGLTSVLNNLGLSPDKLSQSSRSSSAMSESVRLNSGIYVVNKFMREADEESPSVCLSRWRSASPVFRQNSRSPHSSPSRSSDRGSYSPKSQRSSVTVKDSTGKFKTPGAIRTPDSTDSATSGRVSEMSDETQSSPSSKGTQSKEDWQSFSQPQNGQTSNSQETCLNGESSPIKDTKLKLNTENCSEQAGSSKAPYMNGDKGVNSRSSTPPSLSLNLQDLSKHGSNEKRVSFKSKISTSSDGSVTSPQYVNEGVTNGVHPNSDSVFSPQYACPDSLYDDYKYSSMSFYGYNTMMIPNLDISLLFGTDADFTNIKESLAKKISSGKNMLMKNLKGLEQRMSQDSSELLDVKPKTSSSNAQATSPGSYSEMDTEKSSSEFQSADKNFWSFLPPVDISQLLEASKSTWLLTRDLNVLCDVSRLNEVLEVWVNVLHSSQIAVIKAVITFIQNYHNPSGHSYREDDTLRSTCSQITSQDSSPSENCEISDRLEQEDPSVSDSKSYEDDKHVESTHSGNIEISDSSTLRTESVLVKLVNLEDFVFVYDPFHLTVEDRHMISELAIMCFQMKIWGKIQEVIDVCSAILKVKDRIEEALKNDKKEHETRVSQEFSDGHRSSSHLRQSESAHSLQKSPLFPNSEMPITKKSLSNQFSDPGKSLTNGDITVTDNDCSTSSHNSLCHLDDNDSQSAAFVQNYFHLFDVQKLREFLNVFNLPCIKTWSVMLSGVSLLNGPDDFTKKLATEQIDAAASCLERSYLGPVLISHLLKIFKVNSTRAVELCLQRSYHITPLDVLYLSKSSGNHPKPFFEYISRILDCLPAVQRPKILEKLLHLKEVCLEWIDGALQIDVKTSESLKCSCGWPRPGSHLHSWKYSELLLHVLTTSKELDIDLLQEKCFSVGFWLGSLSLVKKLSLKDTHRKLVIQLGDVSLIDINSSTGYFPSSPEEWQEFFALFAQSSVKNESVNCLMCDLEYSSSTEFCQNPCEDEKWKCTLTWETISTTALSSLDSIKVLEILRGLSIPNGALTPAFYQSVMKSFVINKKQSALKQTTLATVGSYLWSRKLKSLSPELRQVFLKEKEKPSASTNPKTKVKDFRRATHSYLEEPESHWGIKISLKTVCKACKMPLTSHLSSSQGGVTVYRCGHSYHTACSSEGFCIACLKPGDEDG
ncbi:serine-rich adhesin for platelets isoform X2 [Parasteatoda tepidariorum]|nr:uncharacterized protein LOC107454818 isoform X2 [Parasteatoda tepidariorum]